LGTDGATKRWAVGRGATWDWALDLFPPDEIQEEETVAAPRSPSLHLRLRQTTIAARRNATNVTMPAHTGWVTAFATACLCGKTLARACMTGLSTRARRWQSCAASMPNKHITQQQSIKVL
jgi:hypothetical protein